MKFALALTIPLLSAGHDPAPQLGEAYQKARAKVEKKAADDLCDVARWCDGQEYFLERDRLYGLALGLEPDHKQARRALRYARGKDGEWVQSDEYAPERNHGRVDLEALEVREVKVWERWARSTVALLDKHEDDLEPAQYAADLRRVLKRFPDHAEVHRRLGHVPGWEGRPWVTPAAKRSHERRKQIEAAARQRRGEAARVRELELEPYERDTGLDWPGRGQHDRARVLSTAGKQEVGQALELIWAAPDFLSDVLGCEVPLPSGYVAYLVESKSHFPALVEHVPGARESGVENVASWWLTGSSLLVGSSERVSRLDIATSQTIHKLLSSAYGLSSKQGWAWEGFGIYLSYKLCGTRLSFSVRPSEYTQEGDRPGNRLRGSGANWLELAHEVLAGEQPPALPFLLGKDVNQLTDVDLLVGYGLAAYVLEAQADRAPAILRRLGSEPAVTVLEEELGVRLDRLQADLTEWLGEVH